MLSFYCLHHRQICKGPNMRRRNCPLLFHGQSCKHCAEPPPENILLATGICPTCSREIYRLHQFEEVFNRKQYIILIFLFACSLFRFGDYFHKVEIPSACLMNESELSNETTWRLLLSRLAFFWKDQGQPNFAQRLQQASRQSRLLKQLANAKRDHHQILFEHDLLFVYNDTSKPTILLSKGEPVALLHPCMMTAREEEQLSLALAGIFLSWAD